MKKMDRGMVLTYSLPRRLLVLFLVFALVIYAIAMAVILVLQQKAQSDVKEDCRGRITQLSSQLDRSARRIVHTLPDNACLHFSILSFRHQIQLCPGMDQSLFDPVRGQFIGPMHHTFQLSDCFPAGPL